MNKTLIVGNWKEHENVHQASVLVHRLQQNVVPHREIEVVLAPSLLALQPLSLQIDHRRFGLAAQNAFYKDEGAYTGEVSFTMLRGLVKYAIIGHSERRIYFNENLEMIRDKVQAAIRNGIKPILCVGETKHERANGETRRVIHDQLTTALANVTSEDIETMVIAYEPVWAISTFDGELAKPSDIKPILDMIRMIIKELYGQTAAQAARLLYGGSVDKDTAGGYLEIEGCDGALIGGASINYQQFSSIIETAYQQQVGNRRG